MRRSRQTFLLLCSEKPSLPFEELQVKSFIKLKGYNGVALFYDEKALQTVAVILGARVCAQVRDRGYKSTQICTNQRFKAIGTGTDDTHTLKKTKVQLDPHHKKPTPLSKNAERT